MRIRAGARSAEECVRVFVSELRAVRASRATLTHTRLALPRFLAHLRRQRVNDLRAAEERHVVSFVRWLAGRGLSASTQGVHLSVVRRFFGFLEERGALLWNPTTGVLLPRVQRLPQLPLSEAQVRRLVSAPSAWSVLGKRDRAVLEVLYGTGLRVGECLGLDVEDVNLRERTLLVRNGKGKVDRVVPLVGRAAAAAAVYLQEARLGFVTRPRERALFLNKDGGRLGAGMVKHMLSRYRRVARIERRVNPHLLRHTCAVHLLRGGADVRQVQLLLGHKQISTTALYTQLEPSDLKRAVEKSHPRERLARRRKGGRKR